MTSSDQPPKKRRRHGSKMVRVNLSISEGILEMVDKAAAQDFTTRSDIIRMSVLWYLRPQGRDLDQADPDVIVKTLQHRKARASLKQLIKSIDNFDDIYDD